jgi:hypothetical protein
LRGEPRILTIVNRFSRLPFLAALACCAAEAQPFVLTDYTTDPGGTVSRGGTLSVAGTAGEAGIGMMSGGGLVLTGGWAIIQDSTEPTGSEPEWVLRATTGPSPRSGHAMAYDRARQVTVLFGGWQTDATGDLVTLGDLWEWDGAAWNLRLPHSPTSGWVFSAETGWRPSYLDQPVPRNQHCLAFDSARRRLVLLGGQTFSPDRHQFFLNDTWEWDGTTWQLRATNGPAPRANAAMAYDSQRGVTVLTGGFLNGADPAPGAVWEWNGTEWTLHTAPNGPSTNYSQDTGGMAYDVARGVILFGPTVGEISRWAFWTWDGNEWQRLPDSFVAELYGLQYGDLAFDAHRRRAVWFGGQTPASNATGFFDGQRWEVLTNNATPPNGRYHLALAYDEARRTTVMFGGETAGLVFSGETWELVALGMPLISEQPTNQEVPAGETATFTVTARGPAGLPLSYHWYHEGTAVADNGRVSGAQSPTLRISSILAADTGRYVVKVRNVHGETASLPATLSLKLDVEIRSAADTITLMWTDPDAVLEMADSPSGPWETVAGATSPFQPELLDPAKFYRLRPAN